MSVHILATAAAVFVATVLPHANAIGRAPEPTESKHAAVSNQTLPSASFEWRLEKAKANVGETQAAVELAHREQRPRPMITRLAEKLPAEFNSDALADIVEKRPSSAPDLILREAIVGLALYLNPPFSRVVNGVEKVPGPYPEEVQLMYAVAVVESIENGPIPSIEVTTLHALARQLSDQSSIAELVWIPQRLHLSSDPRQSSTNLIHGSFEMTVGEGKREGPARSEPAGRPAHRERPLEPRGPTAKPSPPTTSPPPSEPPSTASVAPTGPSPKPSPIDAANDLKSKTDVELLTLATELELSVKSVRSSTTPRPFVQVPKSDPDNTAADLAAKGVKTIFKQFITRPMAIAFTAVDTFISPTRISVASQLISVPGQYPEETAYEKVLREVYARAISRDDIAKRKNYGEWVNSQTFLGQSEADVIVPTLP